MVEVDIKVSLDQVSVFIILATYKLFQALENSSMSFFMIYHL